MFIYFFILSVALSVDALGIGITYRLNGVKIPTRTKLIIGIVTSALMLSALYLGEFIHKEVPNKIAEYVGAIVLIVIGIVFVVQSLFQKKETPYDLDHSRCIEPLEGVLLALALSTDSLAAGIAVASTGMGQCYLGILVGLCQLGFLFLADFAVTHIKVVRRFNQKVCGIISGFLLILIGFIRFM